MCDVQRECVCIVCTAVQVVMCGEEGEDSPRGRKEACEICEG